MKGGIFRNASVKDNTIYMTLNYERLYKHLIKKGEDQTGPQTVRISQSLAMASVVHDKVRFGYEAIAHRSVI